MSSKTYYNDIPLERFLLQSMINLCSKEEALSVLSDSELNFSIRATYFLLDREKGGVEQFITDTLGRLLQQLSRRTQQQEVEYQERVRGHILWPATYKARYSKNYNPHCFVCREVFSHYNTLENQLLKYVIEKINESLKVVPDIIRQGICYVPGALRQNLSTAPRLRRMEVALSHLRRNVALREVTTPLYITGQHLLRAETVRIEEYGRVAEVYRKHCEIVLAPSWEGLINIGKRVLPLPSQNGEREDKWIELASAILRA